MNNSLPFFLIAQAQTQLDSNLAGIFIGATPLATLAVVHFGTRDEKMTRTRVIDVGVGFMGIVIFIGHDAISSVNAGVGTDLLAQGALLLVFLSFALNALISRRIAPLPPAVAAYSVSLLATAMLLPFAIATDPGREPKPRQAGHRRCFCPGLYLYRPRHIVVFYSGAGTGR